MNCQDMEKFIHVYLDREFAEEDRAAFEQHLASCARCRRLADFESRFKQRLKTSLARPHLTMEEREQLHARVAEALQNAPPLPVAVGARRWALRLVPAAAAAGLLVAIAVQQPANNHPAVTGTVSSKNGAQPLGVMSTDPDEVRTWYQGRVSFPVVPPRFDDGRTALVGGRVRQVAHGQAAQLVYQRGRKRFSVTLFRSGQAGMPGMRIRRIADKDVYFSSRAGRNVAAFQHGGIGYTITGTLPEHELRELVRRVLNPSPRPMSSRPLYHPALPVSAP